jgi:crotonobetainyl-CoA:carnitine CoA-transferase CaiB-like acyl-CoA transferase
MVEEAQRRHIPGTPVAVASDLAKDPQLWARGFFEEKAHSEAGRPILSPRGAIGVILGTSPGLAPKLGQHNSEILRELGFSEAEHRAFVEAGAV